MIADCEAGKSTDTHQVHQPIFKKYTGLPQVHQKAEGSEHRRFL